MKAKFLPLVGGLFILLTGTGRALYTIETPFSDVGTCEAVSAATHTWTRALATSTVSPRSGFVASIDSTVTINVGMLVTETTTTPTIGLGVHPEKIGPNTDFTWFPYDNNKSIWFTSIGTFTVRVSVCERGQR